MREKKVINISVMNRNILLEQSSAHNDKTIKISTHMIIIYFIIFIVDPVRYYFLNVLDENKKI